MRRLLPLLTVLALVSGPAQSDDAPGVFDYWILALSWSPQHCKAYPGDEQCPAHDGFVIHGLWPQHVRGYPEYCGSRRSSVPDEIQTRMLEWMPSAKLIRYQWRKHGTCSGMPVDRYFMNVERAYRGVALPTAYRAPDDYLHTSIDEIEQALIDLNPAMTPQGIALQCRGSYLKEAWICLDKDFQPRACGADVVDRCKQDKIVVRPVHQ